MDEIWLVVTSIIFLIVFLLLIGVQQGLIHIAIPQIGKIG